MAKRDYPGWIYIATNPCFRYLKIGYSKNNPRDRIEQLSRSTSIPHPFKLEYEARVNNAYKAEKDLKAILKPYWISKEFYDLDLDDAMEMISEQLKVMHTFEWLEKKMVRIYG